MKKFIIPISLILLLFVAFFLMLILTDTPMDLSLIGSGVATLVAGTYMGLVLMGKPLKTFSTNIDKLTSGKRVGYFIGLMIVNLSVCGVLLETKDATIDTLPLAFYCIAFIVALLVGFFTRKLLVSLETKNAK
ncbi:MAG: hypothetical protein IJZ70_01050 [Bacteroidales bacterium]|nr:hypothetical protein [Bacteroidales bacterium]